MALVAYDYGSNSDDDESEEESSSCVVLNNREPVQSEHKESVTENIEAGIETNESDTANIFSSLPQTKAVEIESTEGQIEDFVPKSTAVKVKEKVKIPVPSLSQFADDEDEPEKKKLKVSKKISGLISLLPPVKGSITTTKTFVPNVLKSKTLKSNTSLKPSIVQRKSSKQLKKPEQKPKAKPVTSDTESEDDFELPETFDDEMWTKICGKPKPKKIINSTPETDSIEAIDIAPEPEKPYEGLDNKAFKELVGKTKRPIGNIKLIDINEEEILPDKDIWMTKSLTDPEMEPKPVIENPVDPTRRKKHHITYLAEQAKANEQEFKNAWASSKNNRLASRAKYGF